MALVSLDKDADSFIERAGLNRKSNLDVDGLYSLDNAVYYVNWLVKGIKDIGAWDCFKDHALYLHLGGTEEMTAVNLCNDNFTIDWFGGVEFTNKGVKFNGIDSYGNTNLPLSNLTNSDTHLACNCITDDTSDTQIVDIGTEFVAMGNIALYSKFQYLSISQMYTNGLPPNSAYATISTSKGLTVGSRTSVSSHKIYRDGNVIGESSTNQDIDLSTSYPIYIGCLNVLNYTTNYYSNREYNYFSIGNGFTERQVYQLNNLLTKFNRSLNRI